MALTQEQKKTISEISQNPQMVLEDFKKKPYYLKSFKDEFYQDGTGLIDKVLYQYLLTEDNVFFELYEYIINNSTIRITDNKGNKPSALSSLYDLKSSFNNFSIQFDRIINHSFINNHYFVIEQHICDLYKTNEKKLALDNIKKFNDNLYASKALLISIIKNDDVEFFEEIFSLQKEKIKKLNFKAYLSNSDPDKSILYSCLENKSEKIASYILNNDPTIISDEKPTVYVHNKKFPPILDVAKNTDLFEKVVSCMNYKQMAYNFNYSSNYSETLLTNLLDNHYSLFLESQLIDTLNSNLELYEKINLLKAVFESNISYEKKFFIFSSGLDENIKETYSCIAVFNSFIFSIQKNPKISQNLFDQFINEFKIRDLISEDYVFNGQYFTNMEYFKLVSNNHVFAKINPLNFVESYLKNNQSKIYSDDTDYIWFKISKLNFKHINSSSNAFNALHLMLGNNVDKYVNFFSEENLSLLLKENFNVSSYRKHSSSKDFFEITEKLINIGFSFKDDINKFLKLLSFNPPTDLLDKIISKENINIEKISNESFFWDKISNQSIFDYCVSHKAQLNNPNHVYSLCYNFETLPLELYLKNNGNINYQSEKGNILHDLCQDNNRLNDEEILLLLDFHPELAVQTNKQNKFAVSYLISDFNRLCKKYKDNASLISNKESLAKYYKIIKAMFGCGLYSENKKAFNILESQLLKYTDILEVFPDLLPTLRAEKLSKKLEIKGIKTKTVKI